MLGILVAVVFLGRKMGIWFYVLCILTISILGYLFINEIIIPKININTYVSNFSSWMNVVIDFIFVIGLVIIIVGSIGEMLNSKLSEIEKINNELQKALTEIKVLQGILPICASCKKIKDDKGYWHKVESYITDHSEAQFSHGLCEECSEKLYGDEDWFKKEEKKT